MTPSERADVATKAGLGAIMTTLSAAHAAGGKVKGVQGEPAPQATIPVGPPVVDLLHPGEAAPAVRVAGSPAEAHATTEADTVLRPVADVPGVGEDAEARVTAAPDVAQLRKPSARARVVTDSHIPVVSQDAVLNQALQTIVNNSGELQRIGLDPSQITKVGDIDAALQIASDHIKSNLDPRAYDPITFEGQKALAADLGMSVEDLLSRKGGEAFNAEHRSGLT